MAEVSDRSTLEAILQDKEAKPVKISFSLLQEITNNFSNHNLIGNGGFGEVYKGVVGNRFVAVKKLMSFATIQEREFHREVDCLAAVKHRNIVRFIGHCAHTHNKPGMYEGKYVSAEVRERLFCLEYMPKGSLDHYRQATGETYNFPWHVCYDIIKGICQGLDQLHKKRITHLDLKPHNILLDDDMVPKITDFGLSRLLGADKSRTISMKHDRGTLGYMAPEYIKDGTITSKADIYSLGALITRMVAGHGAEQSIENVAESWRFREAPDMPRGRTPRETLYNQVRTCIELSQRCMEVKPEDRPGIDRIIQDLDLDHSSASGTNTQVQIPVMLSSRSLEIAWSHDSQYWRWRSYQESRFKECAELLRVYFLSISGEIQTQQLSPDTGYTVYLVYRLGSRYSGFHAGQESSIKLLLSNREIATSRVSKVSLDPEARGTSDQPTYPNARDDGWMELKLAELHPNDMRQDEKSVVVDIRQVNDSEKTGLIVDRMEFRPNMHGVRA